MAINFIQAQPFKLSGSGSSIGDTTIVLQSMVGIDGNNIVTADLGDTCYGTIEPGNGTQEEAFQFTGVTQNSNGTATLTGVSTVLFKQPYTATSGLTKTHAGASTVIISNDAAFYNNIIQYANGLTFAGAPNASQIVKGIVQQASSAQINAGTSNGSSGAVLFVSPDQLVASNYALASGTSAALTGTSGTPSSTNKFVTQASLKFGGSGALGVLNVASGTAINLNNQAVFVGNYTSITATGAAQLVFTNPNTKGTYIVLKSQGDVILNPTLASSYTVINAKGMGAANNQGFAFIGTIGQGGNGATASTAGAAGAALSPTLATSAFFPKNIPFIIGASGGAGNANGAGSGGSQGNGGPGLYIECAGALNFTGAIDVSGTNGGGGGGGGGGSAVILYNTLSTATGVFIFSGGSGGGASNGSSGQGAGGGGGGGSLGIGIIGGTGVSGGTNTGVAGNGGGGGGGFGLTALNSEFI